MFSHDRISWVGFEHIVKHWVGFGRFPTYKVLKGSCITPDATRQDMWVPLLKNLAPFDLTKKKKKTFVVQDAIEDSAESQGRHTIRCLIRHKFEPYRGYIAEHPNDEEEVEGIDLHQQRYPWKGSDMDYLYDEQSSFAQLLSMELTLEIDGDIFHVPNANARSNAQAGNICVAAFDSTCSGICRSADPIVEVNMQCVDLKIIIWKLHFEAFPQHINRP
ncbi:hypothetical protein YC2023_099103 [Brassica napus]